MMSKPIPMRPKLEALMKRAREIVDAMSPEEYARMLRDQRRSWVRGEAGFGSDAEEAEYADALRAGDAAKIADCERRAKEREVRISTMIIRDEL